MRIEFFHKLVKLFVIIVFVVFSKQGISQEVTKLKEDSAKITMANTTFIEVTKQDSINSLENSPLDIAGNRGIYIVAEDGNLQMRILGSVRFSANIDNKNLISKNSFDSYRIPTGADDVRIYNYYNSLSFSRLGFEVTRKTIKGDFFIRLETDFASPTGSYRIRHAYGLYRNYLIGQSWSLLTNPSSIPPSVDAKGAVGTINIRTPQIRYTRNITEKVSASVGLEYSLPDLNTPDTIDITFVQTIPNITARIKGISKIGPIQLSGIIAPITGIDADSQKNTSFGYGISLSGTFDIKGSSKIQYQGTYGNAIAHFLNPFSGNGQDLAYDPSTSKFSGLNVAGGFLSYGHHWPKGITTHLTFGIAAITNKSFQSGKDYDFSYSISGNAFWQIIDGLRIGIEYLYGQRYNIDHSSGNASRIGILFYYDF